MEWLVLFFIIGFLIGLLFGKFIADHHWSGNAYAPRRILYNGKFYKVLDIKSSVSCDCMYLHIPKNRKGE